MTRSFLLFLLFCFCGIAAVNAQNYLSNNDLIDIKEQSETLRYAWNKAFDDGVAKKDFSALPAARQATETYLDARLAALQRLYASGDGRELITAVSNYLKIQKQYVKDIMIPVESLTPAKEDELAQLIRNMNNFGSKEKVFLLDINNALANSPEEEPREPAVMEPPELDETPAPADQVNPGGRHKARKGKSGEKTSTPDEDAGDE